MIMRLKRRAFVDKLDFLTSPGHLSGGDSRARLGLPGGGPELVITDKARPSTTLSVKCSWASFIPV